MASFIPLKVIGTSAALGRSLAGRARQTDADTI
jgi:hypothetical protein